MIVKYRTITVQEFKKKYLRLRTKIFHFWTIDHEFEFKQAKPALINDVVSHVFKGRYLYSKRTDTSYVYLVDLGIFGEILEMKKTDLGYLIKIDGEIPDLIRFIENYRKFFVLIVQEHDRPKHVYTYTDKETG